MVKPMERSVMRNISVLAIDDDDTDLESLRRNLVACAGYSIHFRGFRNWKLGLEDHAERPADIIFLDFFLGNMTGSELLQDLRDRGDMRPVIMLTGQGDESTATESIRFGAADYIVKSKLSPEVLVRSIETAHREYQLRMENAYLGQELRAARHLEAIGTLAGGVAHDFNNFLAGILSSAELAQTYKPKPSVARELDRITGIVRNASEVIRRLLQFNKFYAGAGDTGVIDVHEVVQDTFRILEHSCPKGIEMQAICNERVEPHVMGSSAKMHQILLNLCVNAIEAMESEGMLSVKVVRVTVGEEPEEDLVGIPAGEFVELSVSDTGPGIPDDVRERMFDPFYTTKSFGPQKGTGLGLATVWDCVRDLDGAIRVHTSPSGGSVFRVFLPFVESTTIPPKLESQSEIRGTETILLIDDEPDVRFSTAGLLRRLGYTVHCGASGLEAIALLEQFGDAIDILIMDVSMPSMDGKEALLRIRESGATLPVLMATGHSAVSELEKVTALGADGVVQKPFSIKSLAGQIRTILQSVGPKPN